MTRGTKSDNFSSVSLAQPPLAQRRAHLPGLWAHCWGAENLKFAEAMAHWEYDHKHDDLPIIYIYIYIYIHIHIHIYIVIFQFAATFNYQRVHCILITMIYPISKWDVIPMHHRNTPSWFVAVCYGQITRGYHPVTRFLCWRRAPRVENLATVLLWLHPACSGGNKDGKGCQESNRVRHLKEAQIPGRPTNATMDMQDR